MKIIKPSFEIIEQSSGIQGLYKQIEIGGRTCYKSEDKITEDSAEKFVEKIKSLQHLSVFEHGTVYLKLEHMSPVIDLNYIETVNVAHRYMKNKYSKVKEYQHNLSTNSYYITTNMRVIIENGWEDDLKYLCDVTEYHEKRITVKFSTQIAITREGNRHRSFSISEQSTRYCNYSKDKFDKSISINLPTFVDEKKIEDRTFKEMCDDITTWNTANWSPIDYWLFANLSAEFSYMSLISLGWTPQQARTVLPLDTNTEVVYTAFVSDWEHFFELRTSQTAHPDIQILAKSLKEEFVNRKYI